MEHLAEQYQCNLADICQNMLLVIQAGLLLNSYSTHPLNIPSSWWFSIQFFPKREIKTNTLSSYRIYFTKKKQKLLLQEMKNMIPYMLAHYERKHALQMAICKLSTFQRIVTCIFSYALPRAQSLIEA